MRSVKDGECVIWTGSRFRSGFGRILVEKKHLQVHRVAYSVLIGPIPDGMEPVHRCFRKLCIRPEHLYLLNSRVVDHAKKLHAGKHAPLRGRPWPSKSHCNNGHKYTVATIYVRSNGRIECTVCRGDREANRPKRVRTRKKKLHDKEVKDDT